MKQCKYCGAIIHRHGNSWYCDDDCNYQMRLPRQKEKYLNQQKLTQEITQTHKILSEYYGLFGSTQYIPSVKLGKVGMNWSVKTGTIKIEGLNAVQVGEYCYVLFNNQTIRIWKINN